MTDDKKPASPAREFWIDPNDDPEDDGEIRCFDAFSAHPHQGDLLWQSQLIHVIEISALTEAEARIAELETANANCISLSLHESRITALQEKLAVAEREAHDNSLEWHYQLEQVEKARDAANKRIAELADMVFVHDKRASENLQEANELRVERNRYKLALEEIVELWPDGKYTQASMIASKALNPSGGK